MAETADLFGKIHNCPCCDGVNWTFVRQIGDDKVVKCQNCQLEFAQTQPFDPMAFYQKDYFDTKSACGYEDYAKEFRTHFVSFKRRLENCEVFLKGKGALLDYGCAYGHMAKTASTLGWKVYSTDISHHAAKEAKKNGAQVFVSDLRKPPLAPRSFDLITLYDVIEHVTEPREVFQKLVSLLKPNGLLHITTPDVGSLSAKLMGSSWYHYKPQEHLIYFSRKTITETLRRSGFEVVRVSASPSYMTLHDILKRLQRYSKTLFGWADKVIQKLGLGHLVVKIYTGELQVYAKPRLCPVIEASPQGQKNIHVCPECSGGLQQSESSLSCKSCGATFEVKDSIPIFIQKKNKIDQAVGE